MTSDSESPASPHSPESPASPASPDTPDSPSEADATTDSAGRDELAEAAAAEPVDTEQLERSRKAIDEGREAAAKALDPPPDEEDLNFADVKQNDDPDSSENAVPRPN